MRREDSHNGLGVRVVQIAKKLAQHGVVLARTTSLLLFPAFVQLQFGQPSSQHRRGHFVLIHL